MTAIRLRSRRTRSGSRGPECVHRQAGGHRFDPGTLQKVRTCPAVYDL